MTDNKRNTGRTSRMLERARQLAQQGRAVYVIAANQRHADVLRYHLGPDANGIKVETIGSVGIRLDWETLTLGGAHRNCIVLVDHYTIEWRFGAILDELIRYDLSPADKKEVRP
jgi:hypothetical protein